MAKEKAEWQSRTVAEWKNSKASTWKAQISTSPNGQKFVGVRQYIMTAKSGEIAGKGGISFMEGSDANTSIDQIIKLFTALKENKPKKGAVEKAIDIHAEKPEKKPRKSRKKEEEEVETFGLTNDDATKWLVGWRKVGDALKMKSTEVEEEARPFKSSEDAAQYLKEAKKAGMKSSWRVVRID